MTLREYLSRSRITITALGAHFGLSQPAITFWGKHGVPPKHVLPVCAWTGWLCTPHELRPDLYPNPTDALPQPDLELPQWRHYGGH